MYSGLNNDFLYSVVYLEATFSNQVDEDKVFLGTGFFVQCPDKSIAIVTNRHLLDIGYKEFKYKTIGYQLKQITGWFRSKDPISNLPEKINHFGTNLFSNLIFGHCNEDVAVLKNLQLYFVGGSSEPVIVDYFIPGDFLAETSFFHDKNTSVGDMLAFPGFPEWHDQKNRRPILRMGTIASDPRFSYSGNVNLSSGELVAFEAFSYSGSSGSPVFALQKGYKINNNPSQNFRELKLVGINCGHLTINRTEQRNEEGLHSGISYFLKSTHLLSLL